MQVQMDLDLQARVLVLIRSYAREHQVACRDGVDGLGGGARDRAIVIASVLAVALRTQIGDCRSRTRCWGRSISRRLMMVKLFLFLISLSFGVRVRHDRKGIENSGKQPRQELDFYEGENNEKMKETG